MANRGTKKKKTKYTEANRFQNKVRKLTRHLKRQSDPSVESLLTTITGSGVASKSSKKK